MTAVTKDMLREGSTLVRLSEGALDGRPIDRRLHREWYVVKDLMARKGYDRPGRIGIGPSDMGLAFGVELSDVAEVIDPEEVL